MRYNNYHKHDHYGNPWIADTIVKSEDYCNRAVELGHTMVFTTNHGVTGNIFDWMESSRQSGLKMVYGTEAYYVHNRLEKDKSNRHLIVIARNNSGALALNDVMTEAHMTGFYYRPRIDYDLLFSLNPDDFIITSACVAGIWENRELMLAIGRRFKGHFFLEMQPHDVEIQKHVNAELIQFSIQSGIPIIHANDSHYIRPQDSQYRDIFTRGKGHNYSDEDGMILDYPDSDVIFERYEKQGILTRQQVQDALDNTLIFDECEDITIINDEIKLPSVSENPTADLKGIINRSWVKERQSIPKEEWPKYLDAIRYEVDIIEKTHMENYFLIDYNVARIGQQKYSGRLTNTGRGSAPSFYITKLLGLTDIDRISAPITLFPTRFMSVERILGSRSLPDIDLNTTDREPFIRATEDILGAENCAWMLAWKPLQAASAFRLYCRGIGMDISEYDEIAKNIDDYRDDPKWKGVIDESKRFIGVVESISESPCSMLLYDKPVRRELGLVRTSKGKYCCLLDGYNCDKYKYLKNDYLTVTVWAIIRDVCLEAGIQIPTIRELDSLLDEKTFEIYDNGLTCTINQADSDFATGLVMAYKPRNVAEMSAFVAIIRPGCASLLQDFINRKPYTTGVGELDELLVEGKHRMIYQELIMKYLIWLGIPETGSYDIIKKIAKKKFKEAELDELKSKLLKGWAERVGREDGFPETWTVVEQAARYSFNASHSLSYAYDSLYGAYLKSHYPLEYYTVALNYYSGDSERTLKLTEELKHFNIPLNPIKFRYSRGNYSLSREDRSIYKGIASIAYMSEEVANEIYALKDIQYPNFMMLLYDLKNKTSLDSRQLNILVELDFFSEFGDANYLLRCCELYDRFANRKQIKKQDLDGMPSLCGIVKKYAGRETEKMFNDIDMKSVLLEAASEIHAPTRSLYQRIAAQIAHLGYIDVVGEQYAMMAAVLDVDTKYAPKLKLYSLKNGTAIDCKVDKRTFNRCKLKIGDIIRIVRTSTKPKMRRTEDGSFERVPGTKEQWIVEYMRLEMI